MAIAIQRLYAPPIKWTPQPVSPIPEDLNPDKYFPAVIQSADWTCSCASASWIMNSLGVPSPSGGSVWNEWDGVNELRRVTGQYGSVTPQYGLQYGSGSQLALLFEDYGFRVSRIIDVDWWMAADMSTRYIGQFGGGRWYHWTAVRFYDPAGIFELANPAPSWRGVGQDLDGAEWAAWGPWTGLWIVGAQ
jgi:hypothetical protein